MEDVVDQGRVGDEHALGTAGRAGGVDDVGRAPRIDLGQGLFRPGPVPIQANDLGGGGRQARLQALPGEHQLGARVLQHEGQPVLGVGGVERQVGAARLEHAQHANHHLGRALHAEAHDGLRPHAQAPQVAGQGRRPGRQLAVGEAVARRGLQGDGLRGAGGLLVEQAVDRGFRGLLGRPAAGGEQIPALAAAEDLKIPQPGLGPRGPRDETAQQRQQVLQDPRCRLRADPGPVEIEPHLHPVALGQHVESQGEVAGLGEVGLPDLQAEVARLLAQGVEGIVLEHQHGLEQHALAPHVAPGQDAVERGVLVLPLLDLLLLERLEPGRHGLVRAGIDTRRQEVDEQAHHGLDALDLRRAARDDGAEHHVGARGVAAEQQAPGTLEDGVERHLPAARERPQARGHVRRDVQLDLLGHPARGVAAGAGAVEGEGVGGVEAGERPLPEGLGPRGVLPLDPGDVVAVGAGGHHPHLAPRAQLPVEAEGVGEHEAHGPAVHHQVVEAPDELVLVLGPAEDGDAHQGGLAEVEAQVVVLPQEGGEPLLALRLRQGAPVVLLPGEDGVAAHHLERLLAALPEELRAQGRMPFERPDPGLAKRGHVQGPHQRRDVLVEVDLAFFLREEEVEQHPLLRGRERIDVLNVLLAHLHLSSIDTAGSTRLRQLGQKVVEILLAQARFREVGGGEPAGLR